MSHHRILGYFRMGDCRRDEVLRRFLLPDDDRRTLRGSGRQSQPLDSRKAMPARPSDVPPSCPAVKEEASSAERAEGWLNYSI